MAFQRPGARTDSGRALVGLALKVLVATGCLAIALTAVDFQTLRDGLVHASMPLVALGVLVVVASVPLAALRWTYLARGLGMELDFASALRLTFVSLFFGQVLPAAVGGDAVRGWLACRQGCKVGAVVASLVLDRCVAVLALALLVAAGLPHLASVAGTGAALAGGAIAGAMLGALAIAFLCGKFLPERWAAGRFGSVVTLLSASVATLGRREGLAALACAVTIHALTIVAVIVFSSAIDSSAGPLDCLVVVPFALLVSMVPISVNGWGLREGAMMSGFGLLGLAPEPALLLSVLLGIAVLAAGLPGGLFLTNLKRASR